MTDLSKLRDQMHEKFKTIRWLHHPCGRGSCFENTENTRELLERITAEYNIKTISDAGAGDLSWIHETNWDVTYTPYDIRKWHPDITQIDITKDVLPKTDLIICRHVLNHLPKELKLEAIERFKESGSTYLFMTHGNDPTVDIPFDLGLPIESVGELFENAKGGRMWWFGLRKLN